MLRITPLRALLGCKAFPKNPHTSSSFYVMHTRTLMKKSILIPTLLLSINANAAHQCVGKVINVEPS